MYRVFLFCMELAPRRMRTQQSSPAAWPAKAVAPPCSGVEADAGEAG